MAVGVQENKNWEGRVGILQEWLQEQFNTDHLHVTNIMGCLLESAVFICTQVCPPPEPGVPNYQFCLEGHAGIASCIHRHYVKPLSLWPKRKSQANRQNPVSVVKVPPYYKNQISVLPTQQLPLSFCGFSTSWIA